MRTRKALYRPAEPYPLKPAKKFWFYLFYWSGNALNRPQGVFLIFDKLFLVLFIMGCLFELADWFEICTKFKKKEDFKSSSRSDQVF